MMNPTRLAIRFLGVAILDTARLAARLFISEEERKLNPACYNLAPGEVPERLIGTVSKTVVANLATVGSNPTLSALD
jgi:hypothetical protein